MDEIQKQINKHYMQRVMDNLASNDAYTLYDIPRPFEIAPTHKVFAGVKVRFDKIYLNNNNTMQSYLFTGTLDDFENFYLCKLTYITKEDIAILLVQLLEIDKKIKRLFA